MVIPKRPSGDWPKFFVHSNDPDNMGDPEDPKLNIYSTAGRFSKGTPPHAGTFDAIDLITHLRRHIDNFIGQDSPSNPDLKAKGISIRNMEPEYLRCAIKTLHAKLERHELSLNQNDLKAGLIHLAMGRLYKNRLISCTIQYRDWIDTEGKESPYREDLKEVRDTVLSLKEFHVPQNMRSKGKSDSIYMTLKVYKGVSHLHKCLDIDLQRMTVWSLIYAVSIQDMCRNDSDVEECTRYAEKFFSRLSSRVSAARAWMQELEVAGV